MTNDSLHMDARVERNDFVFEASFDVAAGETVALVGPSGAGKTTCLNAIAGLLPLVRGEVSLGREVWCDTSKRIDEPPYRRHVGFVHQDYALFPNLNVLDNVSYGARIRTESRSKAQEAAREWLSRLQIDEVAERSIATLSGGQKQRVALARALASGARVLLLDEPLGALDASTRNSIRRQLAVFLREIELPVVLVTHDPTDALMLADRIAILENGRISQIGHCDELLTRPRTPFAAELFGVNFYRAEVAPGSGLRRAKVGDTVFRIVYSGDPGPLFLAFPPSAVTLSHEMPAGSAHNVFHAVIKETNPLVDRMRILLECGVTIAADVVKDTTIDREFEPGRKVWASIKSTAIQVY